MYIWMCLCVQEPTFTFPFEIISGEGFYCALPYDLCESFNDISCKKAEGRACSALN